MNDSDVDLAVIGGGPGGSACALAAVRAGLSVALFEPQPGPIDKPCGEGCLASGVRVLEELALGDLLQRALVLRGITYSIPRAPPLCVPFPEVGCSLERHELAAALDRALARESKLQRIASAAQVERAQEGFLVRGATAVLRSRTLAVADGTRGHAADWLRGEGWVDSGRFGLRARCEARVELEGVMILLGDPNAQIYVTPLPGRRLNIALLLDRAPSEGGAKAWLAQALEHPGLRDLAGDPITPPEVRSLARRAPRSVTESGVFLVGDAAGSVDPVVGCGVSIALATGVAAAQGARALVDGRPAREVERSYARVVRRETAARARLAGALLALARHPAWARAVVRLLARAPRLAAGIARVAEG
ncbi:MAG TPA: FAD-dependent oxidoreductase [Planctomycetota bacterium]|nr:FAD-dependent oxidoreductase [Planctomycetota bacterium]